LESHANFLDQIWGVGFSDAAEIEKMSPNPLGKTLEDGRIIFQFHFVDGL
jgi:hypothetical protein